MKDIYLQCKGYFNFINSLGNRICYLPNTIELNLKKLYWFLYSKISWYNLSNSDITSWLSLFSLKTSFNFHECFWITQLVAKPKRNCSCSRFIFLFNKWIYILQNKFILEITLVWMILILLNQIPVIFSGGFDSYIINVISEKNRIMKNT